jgi:hypothetical protein
MRVLIAEKQAAQGESWDFHWCEEGELLTLGDLCDKDFIDGTLRCGCSRSFTGVDSGKGTTAGVVAALSQDEVAERLRRAARPAQALESGGNWREMLESEVAEISKRLDDMDATPGEAYRVKRTRDRGTEEEEEHLDLSPA